MSAEIVLAESDSTALAVRIDRPLERDPAAVYVASLGSESSRATQRSALRKVTALLGGPLEGFPWERMTYPVAVALRTKLAESYSAAGANRMLCAFRGAMLEARRLGLVSAEQFVQVTDLKPVRGSRLPAGRALTRSEFKKLFRAASKDRHAGRRDAAIVALAYGSGIRRAEICSLDLANWRPAEGTIALVGKGNKERLVYVIAGRPALEAWLTERGADPGPLFWPIRKDGTREPKRLGVDAIRDILMRLAKRAKLEGFTCHDLRRSFISDLIDAGADLSAVQQLCGHAAVTTTQRYDRRGERAKKSAASLIRI